MFPLWLAIVIIFYFLSPIDCENWLTSFTIMIMQLLLNTTVSWLVNRKIIEFYITKVKVKSLSPVWLSATPWTVAYQAPPSMEWDQRENKYGEGNEPRTTLRNSKIDCQSRVRWACKMNWTRTVKRSRDSNVTEIKGKDCLKKGVVYHISLFDSSNFM